MFNFLIGLVSGLLIMSGAILLGMGYIRKHNFNIGYDAGYYEATEQFGSAELEAPNDGSDI